MKYASEMERVEFIPVIGTMEDEERSEMMYKLEDVRDIIIGFNEWKMRMLVVIEQLRDIYDASLESVKVETDEEKLWFHERNINGIPHAIEFNKMELIMGERYEKGSVFKRKGDRPMRDYVGEDRKRLIEDEIFVNTYA